MRCHSCVALVLHHCFVSLSETKDAELMLEELRQLGIVASCTHEYNFAHSLISQRQLEQPRQVRTL